MIQLLAIQPVAERGGSDQALLRLVRSLPRGEFDFHIALPGPSPLAGEFAAAGATVHEGGTYICIEGPQFSTRAESELYRSWGMDIIGMTNLTEARLAREAEVCYSTLAMVTDYDCWHPDHDAVTADEIIKNLVTNAATARSVLRAAVKGLPDGARRCECASALSHALVTAPELVPAQVKSELAPIIGKYIK